MISISRLFTGFIVVASALGASPLAHALEVGDSAPCVELNDRQPDGSTVEQCIKTRETGKYLVLEFFSVTCSSCIENLPVLGSLSSAIAGQASTRLVSIDRDTSSVDAFVTQQHDLIQFPVAYDNQRAAKKAYEIYVTPTIFVIDPSDKIVFQHRGSLEENEIAAIKKIVGLR